MNNSYNINIKNGRGYMKVEEGLYSVDSSVKGYVISGIRPKFVEITNEVDEYEFTVFAEGHLLLFVSEEGRVGSTPIVGAKFIRCDENGNTYGDEIVTNSRGEAVFWNIPYDIDTKDMIFYYKQTKTDDVHTFDDSLQFIIMDEFSKSVNISNPLP